MNKSLHKHNKHKQGYNFELLVKHVPEFEAFIIEKFDKLTIDFSNAKAVKALNKALLKTHYNINYWEFPDDNLCPPIPGRVDYIHYLNDLIINDKPVTVLDIGTGASVVYPLLGHAEYGWQFVATDIDKKALQSAQYIIDKNNLKSAISLRFQAHKDHVLEGVLKPNDQFTFTMCNPPFFASAEEARSANSKKSKNLNIEANRNFAGNHNELWYKGGEKAFLHTYLYESSKYPKASQWFTSLVSRKDNIKSLQTSSKKLGVSEFKIIPMHQGQKITRIVCWRF